MKMVRSVVPMYVASGANRSISLPMMRPGPPGLASSSTPFSGVIGIVIMYFISSLPGVRRRPQSTVVRRGGGGQAPSDNGREDGVCDRIVEEIPVSTRLYVDRARRSIVRPPGGMSWMSGPTRGHRAARDGALHPVAVVRPGSALSATHDPLPRLLGWRSDRLRRVLGDVAAQLQEHLRRASGRADGQAGSVAVVQTFSDLPPDVAPDLM
jgi:hypothetical protein